VKDAEWLSVLGKEVDLFVVSGDPRITRGKVERVAWKESELTVFFFGDGFSSLTIYEQAAFLFRRWPDILVTARSSQKGVGYIVHVRGKEFDQIYA
jgi:hypothetical protein